MLKPLNRKEQAEAYFLVGAVGAVIGGLLAIWFWSTLPFIASVMTTGLFWINAYRLGRSPEDKPKRDHDDTEWKYKFTFTVRDDGERMEVNHEEEMTLDDLINHYDRMEDE